MSVETELGLGSNLESVIAAAWPSWTTIQPALGRVDDPRQLREWLQDADPTEADEVVYGIAWLASTEGGHDRNAALALAWLCLTGVLSWWKRKPATSLGVPPRARTAWPWWLRIGAALMFLLLPLLALSAALLWILEATWARVGQWKRGEWT